MAVPSVVCVCRSAVHMTGALWTPASPASVSRLCLSPHVAEGAAVICLVLVVPPGKPLLLRTAHSRLIAADPFAEGIHMSWVGEVNVTM